jgi:hypothetical protein
LIRYLLVRSLRYFGRAGQAASGIWLWFFGGIGLMVAEGLFSEPPMRQRLIGAALTAIGFAGPVVFVLVRPDRRPSRYRVAGGAAAVAITGAALALWLP